VLGTSNGIEWMVFQLRYRNPYESTVQVYVHEGVTGVDGPAPVEWLRVTNLIEYGANDAVFTVDTTEGGYVNVRFGDGVHGRIPSVNVQISSSYRYGVGSDGNVSAGSIIQLYTSVPGIMSVSNPNPATGGSDAESMESMRSSIPRSLGNNNRAVTLDDFATLPLKVPGVAKANATWSSGVPGTVNVYVAPATPTAPSAALKTAVQDYVNPRAILGKTAVAADPTYVGINITATVNVVGTMVQAWVVADVIAALNALFDYDKVNFADRVRLGDAFRAIVNVSGVDYVDITVHSKTGSGLADVQMAANEIPKAGTISITGSGGIVG
jgi:predicted phage baseplate assembly protein